MLMVFGCSGMLGLLLYALNKMLHVLEGINLMEYKQLPTPSKELSTGLDHYEISEQILN